MMNIKVGAKHNSHGSLGPKQIATGCEAKIMVKVQHFIGKVLQVKTALSM